jgi:hypothetical protein
MGGAGPARSGILREATYPAARLQCNGPQLHVFAIHHMQAHTVLVHAVFSNKAALR